MKYLFLFLLFSVIIVSSFSACNLTADGLLPVSMKGYELYSWEEDGQWHFTLITGTNRNKTLEEITTGENIENEDGWVRIHAVGAEGVKNVLKRVPINEFVFWTGGWFVLPTEQAVVKLGLPPEDMVNEITTYAEERGLDFHIANFEQATP